MARGEKRVRDSRKMSKGEIVCLQETKMEVIRRDRAYGGSQFVDWDYLEVDGSCEIKWSKRTG